MLAFLFDVGKTIKRRIINQSNGFFCGGSNLVEDRIFKTFPGKVTKNVMYALRDQRWDK